MAPLSFLLGRWTSTSGQTKGRQERGSFMFEPVAGGDALLRRIYRAENVMSLGRNTLRVTQITNLDTARQALVTLRMVVPDATSTS